MEVNVVAVLDRENSSAFVGPRCMLSLSVTAAEVVWYFVSVSQVKQVAGHSRRIWWEVEHLVAISPQTGRSGVPWHVRGTADGPVVAGPNEVDLTPRAPPSLKPSVSHVEHVTGHSMLT